MILDIGGNSGLRRLRRALTESGTLVIVGGESGGRVTGGFGRQLRAVAISPFLQQRLTMHTTQQRGDDLVSLAELIEAGSVTPCLERTYSLAQVPDALRRLEAGTVRGKVAIIP
jgi:NADPH:quinone reductase-like Zn-dependent oxidoreductase